MAQFSLLWEDYKPFICQGLSSLQQNGELVDMTLAADGHHVKVHRLLISLVSPYLKELLDTASSSHPIIFLNRISYPVLCGILEYVYTGQAVVSRDLLPNLVQAARELRIKGLEEMTMVGGETPQKPISMPNLHDSRTRTLRSTQNEQENVNVTASGALPDLQTTNTDNDTDMDNTEHFDTTMDHNDSHDDEPGYQLDLTKVDSSHSVQIAPVKPNQGTKKRGYVKYNPSTEKPPEESHTIKYTVSQMGSLQMILNRYIYMLRYTSVKGVGKSGDGDGHRQWRCTNYVKGHCPALVITKGDVVVSRVSAHNHTFHDKRILKKVHANLVFSSVDEAQQQGGPKRPRKRGGNDKDIVVV